VRIAYAIPVRHIETLHDGTLAAFGIESFVYDAQHLPTPLVVPLVVTIAASHVEVAEEHRLQLRIVGPDLSEAAAPMMVGFRMGPGPNQPAGWEVRSTVAFAARFEATSPGMYSIEIKADEGLPFTVAVMVRTPE
jgi:hypothetical protein